MGRYVGRLGLVWDVFCRWVVVLFFGKSIFFWVLVILGGEGFGSRVFFVLGGMIGEFFLSGC